MVDPKLIRTRDPTEVPLPSPGHMAMFQHIRPDGRESLAFKLPDGSIEEVDGLDLTAER